MEANDVRDVLGINGASKEAGPSKQNQRASGSSSSRSKPQGAPPSSQPRASSRPEGVTRELYALLGDNAPSIALAATAAGAPGVGTDVDAGGKKFRPKFQRRLKPARKWDWVPFKNPARSDGLTLYHWVPASADAKSRKEAGKKAIKASAASKDAQSDADKTVGTDGDGDVTMGDEDNSAEKSREDGSDLSDEDDEDEDEEVKVVAAVKGKTKGKGKKKEKEQEQEQEQAGAEESAYATYKLLRPDKEPQPEYPFAQFNTTSGVYSYSLEEYHAYLKDDDWSKEESDYLMDLCHSYDLRFIVIHDRYDWPGKERTVEDLKARYQTICRRLIRSRPSADSPELRSTLLLSYNFDRTRETERKRALKRLYTRTPAQLAEEEALYVEARRLEQQEAKFAREREALLKLLGGWEAAPNWTRESLVGAGTGLSLAGLVAGPLPPSLAVGSANAAAAAAATAAAVAAVSTSRDGDGSGPKKKKRKFGAEAEELLGLAAAGGVGSVPTAAEIAARQQKEEDERQGIMRFDPEQPPLAPKPPPHLVGTLSSYPPIAPSTSITSSHGVFLRSTRTVTPRHNLLQKTMESLAELQPTPIPQRLVFPTRHNVEKWEGLIGAISAGLEMKKARERAESELAMQEARLNAALEREKERKKKAAVTRGTSNSQAAR
ncbi:swr complex subunit [Tilletia horrida]|uniref:SWR1-complex protein 4 n=1 Tax=Tilletia horrida TaxID=155126 RepID=A0AAN6GAU5_9BASI|nr:swr complex subunit [Tilletia horrida]